MGVPVAECKVFCRLRAENADILPKLPWLCEMCEESARYRPLFCILVVVAEPLRPSPLSQLPTRQDVDDEANVLNACKPEPVNEPQALGRRLNVKQQESFWLDDRTSFHSL